MIMEALTSLMIQKNNPADPKVDALQDVSIFNLLFGMCIESIASIGTQGSYTFNPSNIGKLSDGEKSNEILSRLVSCLTCIRNLLLKISGMPHMISMVFRNLVKIGSLCRNHVRS